MEAWEDGECPWCRSLLGSGRALTVPDAGLRVDRPWLRSGDGRTVWWERARLVMLPLAALTVAAALMLALS
ncbi:hypothetical protein ACFC08_11215 [Streptomyces sp. NPDC056112]|uniref:hypothetical protein n=1 Tax=unclassified Streptomyces TaxID=2593676 RepID=UPI001CD6CDBC|nr:MULTISPECIES: hypothetical protein [unclassified Streptomyces]